MNDNGSTIDSVSEAMIRRVRRQNAVLKCLCLAVAATLAWPMVIGGAAAPDDSTAQATGYLVTDEQGTVRARFAMSKENNPELVLLDAGGTERSKLAVTATSARLALLGDSSANVVVEASTKEALLRLAGGDGGTSIVLQASGTGAKISMLDQKASPRINLEVDDRGQPMITMWDEQHRTRLTWTLNEAGPALQLINAAGEVTWEAKGDGAPGAAAGFASERRGRLRRGSTMMSAEKRLVHACRLSQRSSVRHV